MPAMNEFLQKLKNNEFPLVVSLPKLSSEMAKAALSSGADAFKVHIGITSGPWTIFRSLEGEKENLEKIFKAVDVPVGTSPPPETFIDPKETVHTELKKFREIGFDFLLLTPHQVALSMLQSTYLRLWFSVDHTYSLNMIKILDSLDFDVLEAEFFGRYKGYGKMLTVEDLIRYKMIVDSVNKPLVIPTRRSIQPEDIPILRKIGIKGVMIGPVVLGSTIDSVRKVTAKFKEAIIGSE